MDVVTYTEVKKLQKAAMMNNKMFKVEFTSNPLSENEGDSRTVQMLPGVNNAIIKSVYVEGLEGSQIDVGIRESSDIGSFIVYKNVVPKNTSYDVVDLAYIDESQTNSMHFTLKNVGTVETTFKVIVLCIATN